MPLRDELCFVQFIHPGGEHRIKSGMSMEWNCRAHKRKFVESRGRYYKQGTVADEALRFWAEWEPQSEVSKIVEPLDHGPRVIHKPYYVVPKSYRGLQNSDPFVFGNFFYIGCQQNTCRGPTQLRYLKRGSVILFGSHLKKHFVLDTVFVVDKWVDHDAQNFRKRLKDQVPREYWDVTIRAWYQNVEGMSCHNPDASTSCRLYWGATAENPVQGTFSYFPCMPVKHSPRGFARPKIRIPRAITDDLLQGKRLNRGLDQKRVAELWRAVRVEVESQGLSLGVHATVPQRRPK